MAKRNTLILAFIVVLFALALGVVLPINEGMLGKRGIKLGLDLKGGIYLVYQADFSLVKPGDEKQVLDGVLAVIENRVDPLGVTEPLVYRQGKDQVVVELPGISITDVQKERIGRTALLEFRELVTDKDGKEKWIPATATVDGQEKVLTSSYFKENTYPDQDRLGKSLLIFEWDETGSKLSEKITSRLIDKPLAIFEGDTPLLGDDKEPIAPIVQSTITTHGQITGLSLREATTLSRQLNAGRLPVPLEIIYSDDTVSPTLGPKFVSLSTKAGVIGILLVMLFMSLYYRLPGVLASLALAVYCTLVLAIFKLVPVTLTLAGIGGFIVSTGMAVDANVLIFERLKEELVTKQTLGAAIEAGFNRAWLAIRDSNLTTLIACGILYWAGTSMARGGPLKGFALTLAIGVVISMFTAITVSRTLLQLFVGTGLGQKTALFTPYPRRQND